MHLMPLQLLLMCIVYGTRLPAGMFIPSLAGVILAIRRITSTP
jgi:hypothetical protein